jgi:cytochrome P450
VRKVADFSITDPVVAKCPFPYYAAMRRDEPVHRDAGSGYWWVVLRESVMSASFDVERLSSQSEVILKKSFRPRAQELWDAAGMETLHTLVTSDPPEHDEYRAVGMKLFTPRKVQEIAAHIEARVHELIDGFAARGTVEFLTEFAARLPSSIVCDEFGLPPADHSRFKAWTDAVIGLLSPDLTEEREMELVQRMIELFKYLEGHLQRSAELATGRVIHTLATVNKRNGEPFTALERGWMTLTTFVGGNETTMNMLTAGLRKLATTPELQTQLRRDPQLVPRFTEELLRLEGSVQALLRVATCDLDIDATRVPKGANVVLCTGSANRDERYWENADEFRLDRANSNRHMAFGYGRHACIGMHLARQELNTTFRVILERLSNIRLAVAAAAIEQIPLPFHRSVASLPLLFESVGR